jgi:hypothetical protein
MPVPKRFETLRSRNPTFPTVPDGSPAVHKASGFGTIHCANVLKAQKTGNSRRY